MQTIFPKVVFISPFSFLLISQLALLNCNFNYSNSKLSLIMNKFVKQNCTFHHLIGKNDSEAIMWPSLLSPTTTNFIERFTHDPKHQGIYNESYSQLINVNRSSLPQIQSRVSGNCEVKVIYLDWTRRNYLILDNLLEGIVLRNENPDYIVFVAGLKSDANSSIWTPEFFNFIFGAFFYTVTSKFLFLDESCDLHLVCSHCDTLTKLRSREHFRLDPEVSLEEVHAMWYRIHKNLDQGMMEVLRLSLRRLNYFPSCNPYFSGLTATPAEDCVITELKKRFNFSLPELTDKPNMRIVGGIYYGQISGAIFNREYFLTPSTIKHSWINYACSYKPYILVTFVGPSNANFLTLLEPLDRYCWVGLIATYIFVTVLIFANSKLDDSWQNIGSNTSRIRIAGLWGLSVLLEQSSHHLLKRFQWTWIAASCWIFLSFIVSNGYKGDLFSSMAAITHPTVPTSIDDLLEQYNLPVMTSTKHYVAGKYAFPTLKDIVLPDMAEGLPPNNPHQRLMDRLVFLNGSDAEVFINISMGLKVNTDLQYPILLSEDFVLVSSEADAKVFTILARRFTKFASIQNANQVSPYITRVPWFAFRNFFFDIFTRSLSSLLETGIYNKWKLYYEMLSRVQALKNVEDKIQQRSGPEISGGSNNTNNSTDKVMVQNSWTKTNYYAMAMLASKLLKRFRNNATTLKGVSLENVKIAIILCSLCAAAALLAFILEAVFHLISRQRGLKSRPKLKIARNHLGKNGPITRIIILPQQY